MSASRPPRKWIVALPGFLLCLAGCTDSEQPLSDPAKSEPDKRLIGLWRTPEGAPLTYLFVGKTGEAGLPAGVMVSRMVSFKSEDELDPNDLLTYLISTKVGDDGYASVLQYPSPLREWPKPTADSPVRFTLVKYSVADGKLTALFMDEDAKAAVIKADKLKGNLTTGFLKDVYLTDTADNIRNYLAKGGAKDLFPDKEKNRMTFTRVK